MIITILKFLAGWTLVSVVTSLAVAPALSRRVCERNFRSEDK
jgi:hypothetical protein